MTEIEIDIDEAAIAIADAMGPDFIDLASPDEPHFDPASLSILVAMWLLSAVAAGVRDAIQEKSKEGTSALLTAIGRAIRGRLSRRQIQGLFDEPALPDRFSKARDEAWRELRSVREAGRDLDVTTAGQIANEASEGVADALMDAGLDPSVAAQVKAAVEIQVTVTLRRAQQSE